MGRESKKLFSKEDADGQQVQEKKLNITNSRKMQIKATMNRTATIRKTRNNCWQGCGENGTNFHALFIGL